MRCLGFYLTQIEFKIEEIREEYGLFIAFGLFFVLLFMIDSLKIVLMGY